MFPTRTHILMFHEFGMRAHSVWLLIACYVYTRCGTIGQGGTSMMGVRDAKGRRVVVYISPEYSRVRT